MAVNSTTRKETFNMGTAGYDFTFRALIAAPTDIKCQTVLISDSTTVDLDYTTDYTVVVDSDGVGGTVTVSNTQSTLYNLVVYRETTNTQESDYDDYNQFPATTLTRDIDKRTMVAQEIDESIGRTLVLPISSTITGLTLPTPSAGLALKWSTTEDSLINSTVDPDTASTAAAASAAAALVSENNAASSETDASGYATDASNSATTASTAALSILAQSTGTINFLINGGGAVITTGVKGDIRIPFACTISSVTMMADQIGSAVVDIWKDVYANYPPTDADSITASAPPTLATDTDSEDTTLTGWTKAITLGDTLRFNVDSVTTVTTLTLAIAYWR